VKQIKNLFILLTGLLILSSPVSADEVGPVLKINRANGDQCVKPTQDMRENHMEYLLHQRDETMNKGIRTEELSLKQCINCHANKDEQNKFIPVTAEGEFCQSCHQYASVKLDCFECHATKPRDIAFHPIVSDKMNAFREQHEAAPTKDLLNKLAAQDDAK